MKYRTIGKAAVALLLAAALLFSAVGCGPQAQTVPETSSSSAAAPEPADSPEEEDLPVGVIAETADTITYEDMLAGEVTIQKRPQRVVVMLNAVMELWYMAGGTAVARIEGEDNIPEEAKDGSFAKGMEMIYKQLTKMLEDVGVTPIEAVGKEFDPNFHNAVMHVDDENLGENVVASELQKGYMYRNSVLRHSMVQVAN